MRHSTLMALILAAVLAAGFGCTRSTGGGEAQDLALFAQTWRQCHDRGLYQATVASVTVRPDGNRRVVIDYVYDNGMVPDTGRAAMLVTPQYRLASECVVDLAINLCMCGAARDWHDGP